MGIDTKFIIDRLTGNKSVFEHLLKNIAKEQIYWKPGENKWCYLEIVCHLVDEEREDFKQRLSFTLLSPEETWPPIDPEGWVNSRQYIKQDYNTVLQQFLAERSHSIDWLHSLDNVNWDSEYNHSIIGKFTGKQILANWLAHDILHIRQINRMNYLYLREMCGNINLEYAGVW